MRLKAAEGGGEFFETRCGPERGDNVRNRKRVVIPETPRDRQRKSSMKSRIVSERTRQRPFRKLWTRFSRKTRIPQRLPPFVSIARDCLEVSRENLAVEQNGQTRRRISRVRVCENRLPCLLLCTRTTTRGSRRFKLYSKNRKVIFFFFLLVLFRKLYP